MKETEFLIRLATTKEVPLIYECMLAVKSGLVDKELYEMDDLPFLEKHIAKEGFTLLACMEDGTIAGFCVVRFPKQAVDNLGNHMDFREADKEKTAHIESMAVIASQRGNGLQKKLLEAAMRRAVAQGYPHLMATVSPKNQSSLHNFEKCGFYIITTATKYGGLERHVLYKNGQEEEE